MAEGLSRSHVRAVGEESPVFESDVFGEKVGLMGKIFGCGHEELSRPFSISDIGFCECSKVRGRKTHIDRKTLMTVNRHGRTILIFENQDLKVFHIFT